MSDFSECAQKLREEIEELRKKVSNQLNLRDGGKKARDDLKRAKELRDMLLPKIEEYKKVRQRHEELDQVRRDTNKSFNKNHSYLYRLFNSPKMPEGLMDQLGNIWKKEKKKYRNILSMVNSIDNLPESYKWALHWINKKEFE